jgi:hypothetical protein
MTDNNEPVEEPRDYTEHTATMLFFVLFPVSPAR